MDEYMETDDRHLEIKNKLRQYYDGRIVRKDLSAKEPMFRSMYWNTSLDSTVIPMMKRSLKRE